MPIARRWLKAMSGLRPASWRWLGFCFAFAALLVLPPALAQTSSETPEAVTVDPAARAVSLAGHFSHLVDVDGRLSLEQVRQLQQAGAFTLNRQGALSAGLLPHGAVWVHFRLAGPLPAEADWWLDAGDAVLDRVSVHVQQPSGEFVRRDGGRALMLGDREWGWDRHAFSLASASTEPVDVFVRYAGLAVLRVDPRLAQRAEMERSRDFAGLFFGAFFGVMTLAMLASLIRFAWFRTAPDAWYACYVASLQMFDLVHSGVGAVLGLVRSLPAMHTMQTLGVMLAGLFLMCFTRSVIQWPAHWARLADRAIACFAAVYLLGYAALHVLAREWLFVYIVVFSAGALGSCLVAAALAWMRGLPNARTFMLAFVPFITVAVLRIVHTLGWIDQGATVMHLFHATTMLHALLLMVAILVRDERTRRAKSLLEWQVDHLNQDLANQTLFIRLLAHEIRNPLAVIDGHSQLLARRASASPEELGCLIGGIRRSVARLGELLDRLLSQDRLSRPAAIDRQPLNLNLVVEQGVAQVQRDTEQHLIRMQLEPGPLTLQGDARLLGVMVSNLLENAVRYSPEGGAIEVRTCLVGDGEYELSVSDEGVGIPPEAADKIFERYYRTGQVPDAVGAGLGLYLVRSIAELHGGGVRCDSVLGEGSTFTVRLGAR